MDRVSASSRFDISMNQYKDSVLFFKYIWLVLRRESAAFLCRESLSSAFPPGRRPTTDTPRNYLEFLIFPTRNADGMTLHAAENDFPRARAKNEAKECIIVINEYLPRNLRFSRVRRNIFLNHRIDSVLSPFTRWIGQIGEVSFSCEWAVPRRIDRSCAQWCS